MVAEPTATPSISTAAGEGINAEHDEEPARDGNLGQCSSMKKHSHRHCRIVQCFFVSDPTMTRTLMARMLRVLLLTLLLLFLLLPS